MRALYYLATVIAGAASVFQNVHAHSQARDAIDYLSLVENPIIHTPSKRIHASSNFDLTFELHQKRQRIKLTLEPNHDILSGAARVKYLDSEGTVKRTEGIERDEHLVFKGLTWVKSEDGWEKAGWTRLVVKDDGSTPLFEGTFTIKRDHHHVMLRSNYMRTKRDIDTSLEDTSAEYMVIFRDSDIGRQAREDAKRSLEITRSCVVDSHEFSNPDQITFEPMSTRNATSFWGSTALDSIFGLSKRQDDTGGQGGSGADLKDSIGVTKGCPTTRKVALVGIVADCSYTGTFKSSQDARRNIINVVNSASEVYEHSFNISLGIGDIEVLSGKCPSKAPTATPFNIGCDDRTTSESLTLNQRLNLFSRYRSEKDDKFAFWTLMSDCRSGSEVGLAWLDELCTNKLKGSDPNNSSAQAVSGASVVARTTTEWQVFAHEAGHIFGAVHDCDSQLCGTPSDKRSRCCPRTSSSCDADGDYIMNPTSGSGITEFSPCTIGQICTNMLTNRVNSECLSNNRDVNTITKKQCGNGIVEEGEDCDCGGEDSCKGNKCCNPKTCKFTSGSECDDSNEECCTKCSFSSSNTVCREGNGKCDPQEKCPGDSGACPKNKFATDGDDCGSGLKCASGQCTSRDEQCRFSMGDDLAGNDTTACDTGDCRLMCRGPDSPANYCNGNMQNFLDGTPCSGGGKCKRGECDGASFTNEAEEWIKNHKNIVIGVAVGVGSLLLLSICACIFRRCRRPKARNRKMAPINMGPMPAPPIYGGGWSGPGGPRGYQGIPNNDIPPPYPAASLPPRMHSTRYA